ncbi:MAG TPA: SDR family NAD(P)-dependent oxidoreductase [Opitutaceae bacterium]|nr:SDR family NAD(P)-dependent oxidoreductase [Opitutaceae bacterium]
MVWVEPEPVSAPALKKIADLPVSSLSEVLSRYSSVVITGGSSGIGKSFIELCAKLNPEVVFCNLSRRAPVINIEKLKLRHFPCDLAQCVEISRVVPEVENFLTREVSKGRMLLINNSGFGTYGPFPEPNLSNTLEMIDVNVRAVTQLTGLLLPLLKARGGTIANVASIAAFMPVTYTAAYAASKAYVLHWSLALNEELRGSGVRSMAFCPGTTTTNFFERAGVKSAAMAGRVSQSSEDVATALLRAIGREQPQAVSGLANKLMIGFCTKLPKPLAARLVARVTGRYWQKQVGG